MKSLICVVLSIFTLCVLHYVYIELSTKQFAESDKTLGWSVS